MNTLTLMNEDGEKVTINVIDIYSDDIYQKEYIFYKYLDDNTGNIYASILNESDTTYSILSIDDETELDHVVKILDALMTANEEEELKNAQL